VTTDKSQARTRYERSHPHIAMRLPTDLKDEWEALLSETGMTKVDFIRWGVRAFREQGSTRQHNPGGLVEQMRIFFRLYEQGDPDALRVGTMMEQFNAAKLIR